MATWSREGLKISAIELSAIFSDRAVTDVKGRKEDTNMTAPELKLFGVKRMVISKPHKTRLPLAKKAYVVDSVASGSLIGAAWQGPGGTRPMSQRVEWSRNLERHLSFSSILCQS